MFVITLIILIKKQSIAVEKKNTIYNKLVFTNGPKVPAYSIKSYVYKSMYRLYYRVSGKSGMNGNVLRKCAER